MYKVTRNMAKGKVDACFFDFLMTSYPQKDHAHKHQQQIYGFRLQVLLVEKQGSTHETDDNRTAAYHGDDGNHGGRKAQGIEIDKVGGAEKYGDEHDVPTPPEALGLPPLPPPDEKDDTHHGHLVKIVPALDGHAVEREAAIIGRRHKILVVQSAGGTQQCCPDKKDYPDVVLEVYAFLLAAAAQHKERDDGKDHTHPLPHIESLAKE